MTDSNDIVIVIPEDKQCTCMICNKILKSKNALAGHIGAGHRVAFEDYLIKYFNNDIKPTCQTCGEPTRYVRGKYSFKRYCIAHANDARADWSRNNGYGARQDAGWKRGLTKETNDVVRRHSEWMKGENNPFYGKQHVGETAARLAESRKITSKITKEEFEQRKNGNYSICLDDYSAYKLLDTKNLNYKCTKCDKVYIASLIHNACLECVQNDRRKNTKLNKQIADVLKLSEEEFNRRIATRAEDFEVLTPYSDYQDHDISKLKIKCIHCSNVYEKTLFALVNGTICRICYPFSKEEKEINEFLESNNLKAVRNSRDIINPKELDFFISDKKLAIEFNGLYWHTENKKQENYHLNKTTACAEKGFRLFHIFSDEWHNKKDVIKSMILNRAGVSTHKIYARDCVVKETGTQEILRTFTDSTHISGHVQYTKAFYLEYRGQIVCALTLRRPFHDKYKDMIEIARFSSSLNTNIPGGFSKLFNKAVQWAKSEGYSGILSYADLRFGSGSVYEKNGMKLK